MFIKAQGQNLMTNLSGFTRGQTFFFAIVIWWSDFSSAEEADALAAPENMQDAVFQSAGSAEEPDAVNDTTHKRSADFNPLAPRRSQTPVLSIY